MLYISTCCPSTLGRPLTPPGYRGSVLCSFMWWSARCGHNRVRGEAQDKGVLYSQILERCGAAYYAGPCEEEPALVVSGPKGQEVGESIAHGLYSSFCGKGKAEQGSVGLPSVNNFGRLWTIVVPSCLVPGPGMIQPEEYFCLECMGQTRR